MNKAYQQEQLRKMLMNPALQSGLYLIDTDLSDEEIEACIREFDQYSYEKEPLIPTSKGSSFELFVIGLSHKCNNTEISKQRNLLLTTRGQQKDNLVYHLVILMIKHLFSGEKAILHVCGESDLTALNHGDLCKLEASIAHHKVTSLIICKKKSVPKGNFDSIIKEVSIKESNKYRLMENRLYKVHISYKHDDNYEYAINAVKAGLEENQIAYSIDEYDIMYRDNIQDYEKEIGRADRVILFVIPAYLKSIDCMFEMTQMFNNGRVKERIFPVVDMGTIPRNVDGLMEIKTYWQIEKNRRLKKMQTEPGNSDFLHKETGVIIEILKAIDDFWDYLVHVNTGNYNKLIENNAALLMKELQKTLPSITVPIEDAFVPTGNTMPTEIRIVTQNGEQPVYIEKNSGAVVID